MFQGTNGANGRSTEDPTGERGKEGDGRLASGLGASLTSLHRRRHWALWMPDLERVALAKVMKDCGRITGTRITFMGCGGGDAGEKRPFKES